jgi:nitric oxide reductase activation protein
VQYYRFKDFDESYSDDSKARLAGMSGGLSTRMGAALRHAGYHLGQQGNRKRLVLLITDGEPADIDERDPQYLRQDTKHAVEELAANGIHTYCLTLGIFGPDVIVEKSNSRYSYRVITMMFMFC